MKLVKIPKSAQVRRILAISLLQIAAIIVAVCCVIAYMAHNGLSKGRWAFFIFVSFLSLSFSVCIPVLYLKKITRIYSRWNWNIMLTIPAVILAILLLAASVVISVHINHSCLSFCALVTVAAVTAFLLTFLFLIESLVLFKKAAKDDKSQHESAIVNHMETQTETQTEL